MALVVLVVELLVVMLPLVKLLLCSGVWAPLVVNPLLDSATVVAVALESACSLLVVQPLSVFQLGKTLIVRSWYRTVSPSSHRGDLRSFPHLC